MKKDLSNEVDKWYHRVLRAGPRGKHGNNPKRRTVYFIFAAVAVCALIVFTVTNPIDPEVSSTSTAAVSSFKKAVAELAVGEDTLKSAAERESEPREAEGETLKPAERQLSEPLEAEGETSKPAHRESEPRKAEGETLKPAEAASAEEVKKLLAEIDEKMQEILNSTTFTKFGPRIKDWDKQREIAKAKLAIGNDNLLSAVERINADDDESSKPRPRILLVTSSHPNSCSNKQGDQMLLKAIKNKMDYCRLHGIEIFYNMDKMDNEMTIWWVKVFLTHMLMVKHPEVDWIWWMDSDAVFTDMSFELPFEKYADYNMVLHGWKDALYDRRSWLGLNAGVFILRNCQWSLDLLYAWAPMSPLGPIRDAIGSLLSQALPDRPEDQADDQSALAYLMISNRVKWGSKIYLESSYYFQGYWRILTEKFEEMMAKYEPGLYGDDRWPFVTHFCGCEFCEGELNPGYTRELCISQMDRAINFADNQVVSHYGFKHGSLESASVQPINGHRKSKSATY